MRIGYASRYTSFHNYQQNLMSGMTDNLYKISSGRDFQFGYQNASNFSKGLGLMNSVNLIGQTIRLSENAKTFTANSGNAIKGMVTAVEQFNQKMVQAANDSNNSTSLQAIAQDLRGIRATLLSLANTQVNGDFIFAGSAVTKRPFNADGTYNGNSQLLQAVLGDKNSLPYNITGSELFFGMNSDHHREIVSNVKHYNQSYLNPGIMDEVNRTELPKEVYLTAEDTLRDLVGDNDWNTSNNAPEVFYVQGVRPDGSSFKAKFSLDVNFKDTVNKSDATKVQDLLDKIGELYGNTSDNKVVDVTLNEYGQINIKDMTAGRSNIDFYMVSSPAVPKFNVDANNNILDENGDVIELQDNQGNNLGAIVQDPDTGQLTLNGAEVIYNHDGTFSYKEVATGTPPLTVVAGTLPQINDMMGFNGDVNKLAQDGARVTTYIQSNFLGEKTSNTITTTEDQSDHRRHTIPTTFRTDGNVLADERTRLIDVLGPEALAEIRGGGSITIDLSGFMANVDKDTPGGAAAGQITIDQTNMNSMTMRDLMDAMENTYGGRDRVRAEMANGKITLVDQNVHQSLIPELPANRDAPYDGESSLNAILTVTTGAGNNINVFANDYTVEYDRVNFIKDGSKLTSNVPQIINGSSQYVSMDTKLSEAAGASLKDTKYTMQYKDIDGNVRTAVVNFYGDNPVDGDGNRKPGFENRVTLTFTDNNGREVEVPLYKPLDNNSMPPPNGVTVEPITPDNMTYQQFTDAISVALNSSRTDTTRLDIIEGQDAGGNPVWIDPTTNTPVAPNTPGARPITEQDRKDAYEQLLKDSNNNLDVYVNGFGQLEIKDNTRAPTQMEFSLYESQRQITYTNVNGVQQTYLTNGSGDYSNMPPVGLDIDGNQLELPMSNVPYRTGSAMTFQSNNALVLDDPHVNIFQKLDEAIKAVELEIYRAGDVPVGAYNDSLRSVGIQGGKQWVEHIEDQLLKVQSKTGAQYNTFEDEIERSEMLMVQTKSLQSTVMDTDIAVTFSQFIQQSINYQSLLSAISKINSLSMVNYI
ncbi:hypothetical protein CCZ01_03800 [Helicobacter monodelphidis]|uniref:flagellin N-terminal helical domain-containing protein n=1 Tax=Helicobacter sp. 15-1451 TaxID=2004995 RepID=UPI000DCE88A9|nr:hypothetical protein [Helicobacter sp. 15-1451]RAX58208.1 hypothetical protein CCZ01_03800 [Helicobacter sp. 15-1451]